MSRPLPDFSTLSPLEYLSLADRERIHTETLRWVLSDDSTLPLDARLRFLGKVIGTSLENRAIIDVATEVKHIDLLVQLDTSGSAHAIAIENKLKSAEHSSQLSRYDKFLRNHEPCQKFFLTLIGEEPSSSTAWQPVSYEVVLDALRDELRNEQGASTYLSEYCDLLDRLVAAVRLVIEQPNQYAGHGVVFSDSAGDAPPDDFRAYVEKMRLRGILQRAWMHRLGIAVSETIGTGSLEWDIGETRGVALIDFVLARALRGDDEFKVGIQLQGGAIKVFAAPEPYPKQATRTQHEGVDLILRAVREEMRSASKITTSQKRGFRSFKSEPRYGTATLEITKWARDLATIVDTTREALRQLQGRGSLTVVNRLHGLS